MTDGTCVVAGVTGTQVTMSLCLLNFRGDCFEQFHDEDVIKRRLLIDGDGTGDDRRLNVLQKQIIKWCNSVETPEENQLSLDRMLAQLAHCEYTVKKSQKVAEMNAIELENYQNLSKKIKNDIKEEKKIIEKTKAALVEAKVVRKNKMECDLLGKAINEQPDRKETGKKLDQLKNELKSLKECRAQIEKKMAQRRQQFHVLTVTIQQLRDTLEEDSNSALVPDNVESMDEDNVVVIN